MISPREDKIINEIHKKIDALSYKSALVECSLFKANIQEERWRIYVLKITLDRSDSSQAFKKYLEKEDLVIFTTSWSIPELDEFLSTISKLNKVYDDNNKYPAEDDTFILGGYPTRIFGNFPREELDFKDSTSAQSWGNIKMVEPYYLIEYHLFRLDHNYPIARVSSLLNNDPPFLNPANAVNYYFNMKLDTKELDIKDQWAGIVMPIKGTKVDCSIKDIMLEIKVGGIREFFPNAKLTLSVICKGENDLKFNQKFVAKPELNISIPFRPLSAEIILFNEDLMLDRIAINNEYNLFQRKYERANEEFSKSVKHKILTAPLIVFLGAGASKPFGKLMMGEFVENLMKTLNSGEIGILETLRINLGNDLEIILEELDELCKKPYLEGENSITNMLSKNPIYFQPERANPLIDHVSQKLSENYHLLKQQCTSLRQNIEKKTIEHYRGSPDRTKLFEVYKPFFSKIVSYNPNYPILPIFTTNYDLCVETYAHFNTEEILFSNGFDHSDPRHIIWRRQNFENLLLAPQKNNYILFKLHGSVDWYKTDQGDIILSSTPHYAGEDIQFRNVLIYPATRKIAIDDPYFTAYEYLQRCLDTTVLCVVVGYSFRDYDTVTIFKRSLFYNKNLRIIIIDPEAKNIIKNNFSEIETRFIPIEHAFGVDTTYLDGFANLSP